MNEKIFVTQSSMPAYEEYIEAIKPLWKSHRLTNMGAYHQELEKQLRKYLKVPEVSLMVNGHIALEMTIQAFEFPKGAEVITTPFTFISTTHAIVRNHLKPIFCDVKESDGTIDEKKIETLITEKTVAILPVHVYGNVCNVEAIQKIADQYGLKVIYDAAHAFGEKYKGRGIGDYGDASIFSFHATKVFNTIEGGAAVFQNHALYEKLYNLKNFGIRGEEIVEAVGANAKMNEFCAIMGLCNLKHINEVIITRKEKWNYYAEKIKRIKGIRLFEQDKDIERNYAYFPIIVEDDYGITRNALYEKLRENDIYARKYFYPLTCDQEIYKDSFKLYKNISVARKLSDKVLCIPFYESMNKRIIDKIIETLMPHNNEKSVYYAEIKEKEH